MAHCLSQVAFLKKISIPDYGGLSVQKCAFLLLWPFLQNGSKDLLNFCMIVEENGARRFSQVGFLKKVLILDCRELSVHFLRFLAFSIKRHKESSDFCMSVEDNGVH